MVTRAVLVLALAACQGSGDGSARVDRGATSDATHGGFGSGSGAAGSGSAAVAVGSGSGSGSAGFGSAGSAVDDKVEPPDPGKALTDVGAVAAWQSVIDRAQYLARRKQHGVVYGRVGPAVDGTPFAWLVDETEGNGALGIRTDVGARAKEGDHVALGGAWVLDDTLHWYWKVDSVSPAPTPPASTVPDAIAAAPSHAIAAGDLPSGARTISVARDNDAVYFMIVGPPPITDGDGWLVANELGDTPVALLSLPGERPSYGSLDMRTTDERWQLKKGVTYWVRIGALHKHKDRITTINARTAPVRVK
ncbi:MAG TPA: hypothetical protein VGM88_22780 [Kofleriaceae bacterium]|jgi:hypothetical protein